MARLNRRERLERAIATAHHACRRCRNDHVTAEYRPDIDDWVPVSRHWIWSGPDDACPVTRGDPAVVQDEYNALWDSLDRADPGLIASYGEPEPWVRREPALAGAA